MPSVNYSLSIAAPGVNMSASFSRQKDSGIAPLAISVAPGKAGTLTTRTDNTTGTLTMSSGHGITTGATIDIYWAGGRQYTVTVGTVSGNSVPFSLGTGTNLPSTSTAIVACVQTPVNIAIDGDNVGFVAFEQSYASPTVTAASHVSFLDADSDLIAQMDLAANEPKVYDIAGGDANPFTGDPITSCVLSNGSLTDTATFLLGGVQDATP